MVTLTAREIEVAKLVTDGLSNQEIAVGLNISENTVLTLPRFPGLLASGHHAAPTAAVYSRS
jgi:Bacterial regulatory proteins, luxR family